MTKSVSCAGCGKELRLILKAIPSEGRVINLVEPHTCDEEVPIKADPVPENDPVKKAVKEVQEKKAVDELFDSFPFVQKLNKDEEEAGTVFDGPKDRRSEDHVRKELVTSTAPVGVLNRLHSLTGLRKPEQTSKEFDE
jgi:hypothetical protein